MSLRVAMVAACPFPARRGTPLRIQRLSEALIARGHDVEVITYHLCGDESAIGYPIHRIFGHSVFNPLPPGPTLAKLVRYDPALARLIRDTLDKGRFDVVHAHHVEGLLAAQWARRDHPIPLVYDAHTMLEIELATYWNHAGKQALNRVGRWLDGRIASAADRVVTVTEDIRDRLIADHHFAPSSVQVAMNGVETDVFEAICHKAPEEPGRIVYTGTLAGYQGIELLLEAFAKARAARPALRLTIAASSSFEPFEAQARELGIREAIDIETDDFKQLPRKLANASIAVLPRSQCPGIPQKLLNYMAAGKAIVACAGSAKVLTDGIDGIVVPNEDITSFANALIRLYDDMPLVQRLGAAAHDYVIANLNWNRTAEICETLYRSLISVMM